MRGKILFAAGLAVGYVFGTRAGKERYEQLKTAVNGFWNDPRVQHRVDQVEEFVREKAPEVAEFVSDGAKKVVDQVTGHGSTSSASSRTSKASKKPSTSATQKPAAARTGSTGSASSS